MTRVFPKSVFLKTCPQACSQNVSLASIDRTSAAIANEVQLVVSGIVLVKKALKSLWEIGQSPLLGHNGSHKLSFMQC